jgi:hypothetical protein
MLTLDRHTGLLAKWRQRQATASPLAHRDLRTGRPDPM